jgi:hypothetical protein
VNDVDLPTTQQQPLPSNKDIKDTDYEQMNFDTLNDSDNDNFILNPGIVIFTNLRGIKIIL